MKDTTGFFVPDALMNSAASSSAVPPISPIMMMPSVCQTRGWGGKRGGAVHAWVAGAAQPDTANAALHAASQHCPGISLPAAHLGVLHKALQAVHKVCAVEGVTTDAHHRGLAQPLLRGLEHGLRGQVGERGWRCIPGRPAGREERVGLSGVFTCRVQDAHVVRFRAATNHVAAWRAGCVCLLQFLAERRQLQRLPDVRPRRAACALAHLVSERAGARDNADLARLVDVALSAGGGCVRGLAGWRGYLLGCGESGCGCTSQMHPTQPAAPKQGALAGARRSRA